MNISTLGLIYKSGNTVFGFDPVKEEMQKPDTGAQGILLACDLSAKTKKELEFFNNKLSSPLEMIQTEWSIEQIGRVIGKKTGIIAVMDAGFWKSLTKDGQG